MATNTTATATTHTGNGSTNNFSISFTFLANAEIDVTVAGVLKTLGTHYNIVGSQVQFTSGNTPANGAAVKFQRDTNISTKKVDFQDGSVLTEADLDTNSDQVLFAQQEITDKLNTIEEGATGDQTITEIKALIAGSPLDDTHLAANSVGASELADNAVDTNAIVDANVTTAKIADLNVTTGKIADLNITTGKIADDAVTDAKLADHGSDNTLRAVGTNHIKDDAVTTDKIADGELVILAGMQAGTASKLADSTALTSDIADLNQIDGLTKQAGDTLSDTDDSFPTSKAVVNYVAAQIAPLGGLEVIADEDSFPTQPSSGVVISISNCDGIVINSSGVCTTARTAGNGSDNVTINNFPASLQGKTLTGELGLMVSSTGSGNIYNYHKLLAKEADVEQLSNDINDFANRYRVGATNPTTDLDQGDLFFNTTSQQLFVYNGSAWELIQSVGNFFISTLSPAFNGTLQNFTITNAPTSAQQILLSINGVIQKPNAGTSTPSEGFALDGSTIKLAAAPPTGSSYHAVVLGSTVNIATPSDNTVTTDILQSGAVTNAKVATNAAIQSSKLAFNNTGTGVTTRTVESRLLEITSVKDYGATGDGSTDDTIAFSNAVKAADAINNIDGVEGTNMPRADMCRVHVPAGTYKIGSLVDTNNREVVYIVDQAAKFTTGSNNHLNGELVREGQFNINTYQHGSTDYAVTYAIRANTGSANELGGGDNLNAEILGVTAPNQLAVYKDRDSVGLYVDNENALPLLNVNSVTSYAATSVTLASAPSADVLKRYRKGMIIDTKHSTPFVGVATSWSANGQTINVQTGWYQHTTSATPPSSTSTPSGTDGLAIGFKKVWAHNANVHIYNGGYAERACGFELGIRNYKADSQPLFSNDANRIWGFDAVNLSGANDGAGNAGKHGQCGFIARTSTSNASWQHGFMAQDTINGFTAHSTGNNSFQYVDSNNKVIFRVGNDGSLQLGKNDNGSNVNRFIDFHSGSEDNDFDARIASVGGTTNDGQGTIVVTSSQLTATGGTFNLGANNSGAVVQSQIDFHSSGEDNDFDGRLVVFGGDTNDAQGKAQIQCRRFGIIVNGSDQRWGFTSDGALLWTGHNSFSFDSTLANGYVMANGFSSKAGTGHTTVNNAFNIYWTSTVAQLYIDSTNLGSITLSSDYRIKKDITTQTASGIDKIKQLRPVNYEFTDNADLSFKGDGVKREGFIAHEVAEVIPSAVEGEKDATNQIQSLRVDAIVSVLTKALQEAVAKIEVLETKVAALEAK